MASPIKDWVRQKPSNLILLEACSAKLDDDLDVADPALFIQCKDLKILTISTPSSRLAVKQAGKDLQSLITFSPTEAGH